MMCPEGNLGKLVKKLLPRIKTNGQTLAKKTTGAVEATSAAANYPKSSPTPAAAVSITISSHYWKNRLIAKKV